MIEFIEPWREDMSYMSSKIPQNELGIDIATCCDCVATELVSYVRGQYPRDTQKQVEALHLKLKLHALNSMLHRLQPVQKRESGVTANVLLSLIDRTKKE